MSKHPEGKLWRYVVSEDEGATSSPTFQRLEAAALVVKLAVGSDGKEFIVGLAKRRRVGGLKGDCGISGDLTLIAETPHGDRWRELASDARRRVYERREGRLVLVANPSPTRPKAPPKKKFEKAPDEWDPTYARNCKHCGKYGHDSWVSKKCKRHGDWKAQKEAKEAAAEAKPDRQFLEVWRNPGDFFVVVYDLTHFPDSLLSRAERRALTAEALARRHVGVAAHRYGEWVRTPWNLGKKCETVRDAAVEALMPKTSEDRIDYSQPLHPLEYYEGRYRRKLSLVDEHLRSVTPYMTAWKVPVDLDRRDRAFGCLALDDFRPVPREGAAWRWNDSDVVRVSWESRITADTRIILKPQDDMLDERWLGAP